MQARRDEENICLVVAKRLRYAAVCDGQPPAHGLAQAAVRALQRCLQLHGDIAAQWRQHLVLCGVFLEKQKKIPAVFPGNGCCGPSAFASLPVTPIDFLSHHNQRSALGSCCS
jgi:hypothetical protein